jgi:hypothetical protein
MQDLCESLTCEIISRVTAADRWLLQFVCRQFKKLVKPPLQDPRRRRVLDVVLDHAVSNGGLATVRFLFHKESCVWATAVKKAASKGDLEMVGLLLERGCSGALQAALIKGHVGVAEYLYDKGQCAFEEMLMASAGSGSRAALEWVVAKMSAASFSASEELIGAVFVAACSHLECVQYLCDFFGKTAIAKAVFSSSRQCFVFSASLPVLRFLRSTFDYYAVDAHWFDKDRPDLMDFYLETEGVDKMKEFAAINVHVRAFLVCKGLILGADLATAAANVYIVRQLQVLMDLYPDPQEWIEKLGPSGRLKQLLEIPNLQAAFGSFFRRRKCLDFEIRGCCHDKDAFDALRAMGGRCTWTTFWRTVCDSDDVENARIVWNAMEEDQEQSKWDGCKIVGGPDIEMLQFVASELGLVDRLRQATITYGTDKGMRRLTVELARFLLEHQIEDAASVLSQATSLMHMDVVKMVSKHQRVRRADAHRADPSK